MAARPKHRGRGRTLGHAYRRGLYEQIVEDLLAEASVGAQAIASVVGEVNRTASPPDHSALDRIARERELAMARYLQDRDAEALEQRMNRLDLEEAAAESREGLDDIPAGVAVRDVQDLPKRRKGRRRLRPPASGERPVLDRMDVLGLKETTVQLSARRPTRPRSSATGGGPTRK